MAKIAFCQKPDSHEKGHKIHKFKYSYFGFFVTNQVVEFRVIYNKE